MTLDPQQARQATGVVGTAEHARQVRKAALASTVGTTIEWYDYFLYGTAAALVFPAACSSRTPRHYVGTLESFATYFVGFAARPIGAAIFGHWGDRIGRKATLIVTLLLMGLSTTLIGVLPGAAAWGNAAPVLLILLRVLQGIAVGGEWSGSVLLSMEWGDQKRRGLMGSWPQLGVASGLILGTGLLTLFSGALTDEASSIAWGWRVPFLCSLRAGGDRPLHPAADPRDPDVRQGRRPAERIQKTPVRRGDPQAPQGDRALGAGADVGADAVLRRHRVRAVLPHRRQRTATATTSC